MKPLMSWTKSWNWFLQVAVLGGLYFLSAMLGEFAAATYERVQATWIGAGLAIAGLWRGGCRLAPGIGLGAFVFARLEDLPLLTAGGIALASLVEPMLAVFLVRRCIIPRRLFDRVRHVFLYFLLAGLVATGPSAALGAASLCWGGVNPVGEFSALWMRWWWADLMGVVTIAPALLVWTWRETMHGRTSRKAETTILFGALAAVCALVFSRRFEPFLPAFPVFPAIMWAGLRLGERATVCASLLASAFALWGTLHGAGPFVPAVAMTLPMLQTFIVFVALTGLVTSAGMTELKETAAAARESEARKSTILESSIDAILSIDQQGAVREWNAAAEKLFQYRRVEAIGRSLDELIVPADRRAQYLSGLGEYLTTGVGSLIGRPIELTVQRADATEIPAELVITRVAGSEPPIYAVIIRDLTQRKQFDQVLRAREAQLRSIIESVPNGMVMVDHQGCIALVNTYSERLFGYSRDELLAQPVEILIPERHRGKHLVLREEFLKSPETRPMGHGRDLFARRKDGSEFRVEIALNAVEMPAGRFVLASVVDITDRKRAEEALQQSEAHFRRLAESLPQLVWTCRANGTCDYMSPQWSRYTGIPEQELIGRDRRLAQVHPEDLEVATRAWQHAIATGVALDAEFRIRRDDGEYRWFRARAVPIHGANGQIEKWVGTNTEIDAQKRARSTLETEIRTRTEQLQSTLNSMEELLYTIAHDLRAPNRAIHGFAHLLQLDYGERLDDNARDYLDRIRLAALRSDELIRDLLEYGRVSNEALPLTPMDLGEIAAAAVRELAEEAQQRHARVLLGQNWPRVLAHETMLKQILANLITNALHYGPSDKAPEIEISAHRERGRVVLRVKDNGIGIPADQIDRAFKPFVRLPNSVMAPGTGMGLAIVKRAAERMNGRVGAESAVGKGSCFWVELSAA